MPHIRTYFARKTKHATTKKQKKCNIKAAVGGVYMTIPTSCMSPYVLRRWHRGEKKTMTPVDAGHGLFRRPPTTLVELQSQKKKKIEKQKKTAAMKPRCTTERSVRQTRNRMRMYRLFSTPPLRRSLNHYLQNDNILVDPSHPTHQFHANPRSGVDLVEVEDQLRQVLDGVDVVVRRGRNQSHPGFRSAQGRDVL